MLELIVGVLGFVLFILLVFAQLELFSIDRTLKDIRRILGEIAEQPRYAPEPYSPEAFAAARKAREHDEWK